MQSPGPGVGRRQSTLVANRVQLFEGLIKSHLQPLRSLKQRRGSVSAANLDAEHPPKPTTLNFKTHYQCAYGEQLKLVGSTQELGNWDVGSAPSLSWTNGDSWTGQVALEKTDDAAFKLVLLSHGGLVWEPVSDRRLSKPDGSQLSVDMAWGTEGCHVATEKERDGSNAGRGNAASEFDLLWNPAQTAQQPTPSPETIEKAKDRRSSFAVTLEPEWGVLDLEPQEPNVGLNDTATDCSASAHATANSNVSTHPQDGSLRALALDSAKENAISQLPGAEQGASTETEGRGLVKKRKKNRGRRSFEQPTKPVPQESRAENLFSKAKSLAVGAVTAATMAVAGVHGQDLIMGTFSIATGAALIPRLLERKAIFDSEACETVRSVITNIGESALKAASIFNAVQQHFNQKTQQASSTLDTGDEPTGEEYETLEVELSDSQMAEYIDKLAKEAAEYALRFVPTEQASVAASLACQALEKENGREGEHIGKIVSTDLQKREESACKA